MSGLSDADRARAREVAAAMPPWTDEDLDDLARIVDSAPPPPPRGRQSTEHTPPR